ncbi:hypothetical protein [Mesorhizobium sp. M4A.F.Ca.ET.090.04.2.1]|uniref:hypothetical protein n=1 Tax=Mesorhizobium sp. M4A.F.Ca.ET.090.04.2.1 TaxID=2496663 RepID=UPI000FCC56D7|nr:hypothetical protein [Mesorhizobium sp. M4A.F.Ca.ET.090.04.2.1]
MDARGARTRSIEGAAHLFDRANIIGRQSAVDDATASIVASTVFLEQAMGVERTIAILTATIEAVRNGRMSN